MLINDIIYFDGDNVKVNTPTKVIYKGFLCQNCPKNVYMHYGYGLLWENLSEIRLCKNINGNYEADITINKDDLIFFCFRDSNNIWDNNYGQNYMIEPISEHKSTLIPITSKLDLLYPKLRKGYFVRKKIRITIYKIVSFIGKLISGNINKNKSTNM